MPGPTPSTSYQYTVSQPCSDLGVLQRAIGKKTPEALSNGAFSLETDATDTNACTVYVNFDAVSDARGLAQGYTKGLNRMWGNGDTAFVQKMQQAANDPHSVGHVVGESYMKAQEIIDGKSSPQSLAPSINFQTIADPAQLLLAIDSLQVPSPGTSIQDYTVWFQNMSAALMALYSLISSVETNVPPEHQNINSLGLTIDNKKHQYVEEDDFGFRYDTNNDLDAIGSRLQALETNLNDGLDALQTEVNNLGTTKNDVEARVIGNRILTAGRKLTAQASGTPIDMGGAITTDSVRDELNAKRENLDANFIQAREAYKKNNPIKQPKTGGGGPSAASTSDE